jgi:hypothetical protein
MDKVDISGESKYLIDSLLEELEDRLAPGELADRCSRWETSRAIRSLENLGEVCGLRRRRVCATIFCGLSRMSC